MCSSSSKKKKCSTASRLVVEPLDRLVIMGQSGSGKSTILRLILGILQPTAGSSFSSSNSKSRDCRGASLQQVRTRIGMVYQYSALLSSRNVRDNIALPLEELTQQDAGQRSTRSSTKNWSWSE